MDEGMGEVLFALIAAGIVVFGVLPWLLRRIFRHWRSRRVHLVRVAEAADGQACRLVGTVRRHPDHPPLTTRFSEKKVLWCRTRLVAFVPASANRESDDNPFEEQAQELTAVDAFWLEDDSGRVLVRLFNTGTERELALPSRSYKKPPTAKVEALLEEKGRSLQALLDQDILADDLYIEEELLSEGDRVVVVGTCRQEAAPGGEGGGAYREAPLQRVVQGERTLPLRIYSREEDVARLSR